MNAFKYIVAIAFFVACVLAVQAVESETQDAKAFPAAPSPVEAGRQKRFPFAYPLLGGLGYSAISAPLAYHAPITTYSAYHAPIAPIAPISTYSAYHAPIAPISTYSAYHAPLLY